MNNNGHLEKIYCTGQSISHKGELALCLTRGGIHSITEIAGHERIRKLTVYGGEEDSAFEIESIGRLPNLDELEINICSISDLSFLPKTIKSLSLSLMDDCQVKLDWSMLRRLKSLEALSLTLCELSDISFLAGMKLKKLDITFNSILDSDIISDISVLQEMTSLTELALPDGVTDISVLAGLEKLKKLSLPYSVKDISPLTHLKKISSLSLFLPPDAAPDSVRVLLKCEFLSSLEELFINAKLLCESWMEKAQSLKSIEIIGDCEKAVDIAPLSFCGSLSSVTIFASVLDLSPVLKLKGLNEFNLYPDTAYEHYRAEQANNAQKEQK